MPESDNNPISGKNDDSQKSPVPNPGDKASVPSMSLEEAWKIVRAVDDERFFDAAIIIAKAAGIIDEEYGDEAPGSFWNYRVLEEVKDDVSRFSIIEARYREGKIWAYSDVDHDELAGCWEKYDDLKRAWETINDSKRTWETETMKEAFDHPAQKIVRPMVKLGKFDPSEGIKIGQIYSAKF